MPICETTTVILCGQDFTVSTGICTYCGWSTGFPCVLLPTLLWLFSECWQDSLSLPLEISVSHLGSVLPHKGHLTLSRDIFGCHNWREYSMPLTFNVFRSVMFLNMYNAQNIHLPTHMKEYSNSKYQYNTIVEKLFYKEWLI